MAQKIRSDAVLKNLPKERQEQLAEWCRKKKEIDPSTGEVICPGGLDYALEQLLADGVKVSRTTLSDWFKYWRLREDFNTADNASADVAEFLKKEFPGISQEKIGKAQQLVFTIRAANQENTADFVALEQLRLSREIAETTAKFEAAKIEIRQAAEKRSQEKLALEREKWIEQSCQKILKAATDTRAKEIAESKLSNREKIAALRQAYFADVDKAQATLRLPE